MSEHDSEDESDVLEESPCGRWLKRREEVEQHDVPGIDATYLAMDTEEGVEVVWNEIRFSERKLFCAKEKKVSEVFDRLIQLEHPNIVKLHKYWIDKSAEHPRLIFITEYMSSGSLKQFLKKTRRNVIKMALTSWSRWCSQILSAIYYLHTQNPPMVHGNLDCDRIFMSHNGLIKIGWVGGMTGNDVLRQFKTIRDINSNVHYVAPELLSPFLVRSESIPNSTQQATLTSNNSSFTCPAQSLPQATSQDMIANKMESVSQAKISNITDENQPSSPSKATISQQQQPVLTTAADIYSFGVCALEMAALGLGVFEHKIVNGLVQQASLTNATPNASASTNPSLSHSSSMTNCTSINGGGSCNGIENDDAFPITIETIHETLEALDNTLQKDLIQRCLNSEPLKRPTAHDLIFHQVIFKVPSLRLIAAHKIVNTTSYQPEQLTEDALFHADSKRSKDAILAEIVYDDGRRGKIITQGDCPRKELDKFLEEVRIGVYPLINLIIAKEPVANASINQTETNTNFDKTSQSTCYNDKSSQLQAQEEPSYDKETRRIVEIMCNIKPHQKNQKIIDLTLLLRMDDKMNRQLSCVASLDDSIDELSAELVSNGLIHGDDCSMVSRLIEDTINRGLMPDSSLSVSVSVSQSKEQIAAQK